MTRQQTEWLAASMMKEDWPEVWIEPGVRPDDWRVSYRRLPSESPRHAVTLSAAIKARCERDLLRNAELPPVEILTRAEAASRTQCRPGNPPGFQGTPLTDGEALRETDLPCPRCEDEGRKTLDGETPRLRRREDGDFVCVIHGDIYTDIHDALNRKLE